MMQFHRQSIVLAMALQTLLTGCSTITKDANQPVKVETYSKNNVAVTSAKCVGKNERGEFTTDSSGMMRPHLSGENLLITCRKDGEETSFCTLISRANCGMFSNIFLVVA